MAYNLTLLDTGNTTMEYFQGLNSAVGGIFALFFLFVLFIIMLMGFKSYDSKIGFIASSTICSILATLMWAGGLFHYKYIFVPVGLLFLGLMWKALGD